MAKEIPGNDPIPSVDPAPSAPKAPAPEPVVAPKVPDTVVSTAPLPPKPPNSAKTEIINGLTVINH